MKISVSEVKDEERIKPAMVIASNNMRISGVLLLRKEPGPNGDYSHAISLPSYVSNVRFSKLSIYFTFPKDSVYLAAIWVWHIVILRKQHYWLEVEE